MSYPAPRQALQRWESSAIHRTCRLVRRELRVEAIQSRGVAWRNSLADKPPAAELFNA
jgi:hypothetical protein